MARTKSNTFHFLPVAEGCKSSSLLRALAINPTQMETVQAIVKSHKGEPKMTRTEMTEICKKLFKMSYPPYWLFKNIAIRVAGTKLFDLSRLKVSEKPVKPPKADKPKVAKKVTEKGKKESKPKSKKTPKVTEPVVETTEDVVAQPVAETAEISETAVI